MLRSAAMEDGSIEMAAGIALIVIAGLLIVLIVRTVQANMRA
jgi:hypothetical protein